MLFFTKKVSCIIDYILCIFTENINPIQYGGGQWNLTSSLPLLHTHTHTSISRVTSTNVGFSPTNFLTFSFKSFATLV